MSHKIPKMKSNPQCSDYAQLLHYTNPDALDHILNDKTLKCSSLKNVNDKQELQRDGIEDIVAGHYVACFCHNPVEIVPFWYVYGGNVPDNEKVLLRFKNFSNRLPDVIEDNWALTPDRKKIYFDYKDLFSTHIGGLSCSLIDDPETEKRQTVKTLRLFDIEYLPSNNEAFTKSYSEMGSVAFGEGSAALPARIKDARDIGRHKTVHWQYEDETRIQCALDPMGSFYHNFIFLRIKEEMLRDLVVVTNPWASKEFFDSIADIVKNASLPAEIRDSIQIERSELHGLIVAR